MHHASSVLRIVAVCRCKIIFIDFKRLAHVNARQVARSWRNEQRTVIVPLEHFKIIPLITIFDRFTFLDLDITLSLRFSSHSHDSHAECDKNDNSAPRKFNFPNLFTKDEDVAQKSIYDRHIANHRHQGSFCGLERNTHSHHSKRVANATNQQQEELFLV